jgi:peptide/nickel transport system substrate-binding protein
MVALWSRLDIADPLGVLGTLFFHHLYPPFNDVRARRAILTALSQQGYMQAYPGTDSLMWKPWLGVFPGSPLYNEEGGEVLKGPPDLDKAKRLLAECGYAGESVTLTAAQDNVPFKAWAMRQRKC